MNSTGRTASSGPKANGRSDKDHIFDVPSGIRGGSDPKTKPSNEIIIDADTLDVLEPKSAKMVSSFDKITIFAPGGDLDALDLSMDDRVEPVQETGYIQDGKTGGVRDFEAKTRSESETDAGARFGGRFIDSEDGRGNLRPVSAFIYEAGEEVSEADGDEEEIIDLNDAMIVPPETAEHEFSSRDVRTALDEKTEPSSENAPGRCTAEATDRSDSIPAEKAKEIFPESGPEAIAAVSPEQLEAALEQVINRIFTQRIEAILREVIEKSVSEEIRKWRGGLLDNIAVEDDL